MAEKFVVGLLTHGGGAHVGAYLQALADTPQCDGVLLADPDQRWESDARRILGNRLAGSFRDYREVLSGKPPGMALITWEARLAPPVIDAALEAGCHVLAEKPSCIRSEDFVPLVRKADSKHRYLMLALANRLNPEIQAARQMLADGVLGSLYGIELQLVADQTRLTRPDYRSQWFAHKTRAGGGHLLWLGIHWLDLAMYLADSAITQVAGFTANVGGQPVDVEDSAAAALRFDNGMLGTITSGYYLDKGYHSYLKIWGSAGWMQIEPMEEQPLHWYTHKTGKVEVWGGGNTPRGYTPWVQAAVRACAEMNDPPISSGESLRALQTVFSIYDAAANGRTVTVGDAR
jgi:UDP-N-acetyl-2-amino-2-deoxyglucuronate dehydrogenase